MNREKFEALSEIAGILKKGVFKFSEFTKSYEFVDAMVCVNARPSQHKDHGYLNGACYAFCEQEKYYEQINEYTRAQGKSIKILNDERIKQEKRIEDVRKEINDFFDNQTMTPSAREYANKLADVLEILK